MTKSTWRPAFLWAIGMCLLWSMETPAVNWRLEADWRATDAHSRSADLPLVEAGTSQWHTRYELSVSDAGARLDLRFEPYEEEPWEVRQAFYDARLYNLEMTLGKKSLHWDYGYLAHPLNMLGPQGAVRDHEAERLLALQSYRGLNADEVVCTLRLESRRELCVVRTRGLTGALDWQLLAGFEEGWRLGAGASLVTGERFEWHASLVWYQQQQSLRYPGSAMGFTSTETPAWVGLAGAQVSGRLGWQLLLEHGLDTRALRAEDWQRIEEDLAAWAGTSTVWSLVRAWGNPVLTRHRSMIRATQIWRDFDVSATLVGFWAGSPSIVSELAVAYDWTPTATLSLGWRSTNRSGILGQIGQSDTFILGFNWVLAP